MRTAVLIPVRDPGAGLPALVEELLSKELPVVLVDDGSTRGQELFAQLTGRQGVTVLTHARGLGRGAALKTGLAHLMEEGFDGAVTAEGDGRHSPEDICRVARALEETPDTLILGSRDPETLTPGVRRGSRLARLLLRVLYTTSITDPLTRLRGIPLKGEKAPELLALKGDRFDYEACMLREASELFAGGQREVPVGTYPSEKAASDPFRTVYDGVSLVLVLLHKLPFFVLSSATAFGLDYLLFNLLYYVVLPQFSGGTFLATVGARVCSATYNYNVNKHLVFRGSGTAYNAKRFFLLATGILMANLLLMHLLVDLLGLPAYLVKIPVDVLLFLVNFTVQHAWSRRKSK